MPGGAHCFGQGQLEGQLDVAVERWLLLEETESALGGEGIDLVIKGELEGESALLESPLGLEEHHVVAQVAERVGAHQLGQQTLLGPHFVHLHQVVLEGLDVTHWGTQEIG